MKKLVLSAAILLGSLSATVATANNVNPIVKSVSVADEYTEIKVEELPAAVSEAFKKAYPEGVINKAFVNEKKEYKIEVKIGDKEGFLYADEKGTWIQQ
ncbi:hypothetical protein [Flavobacterium agrisoli]|uniref:PepSY-like beta-lactamase-inhibitor n=1 Tax=Flavobacterium agrisoli TaxID=2793066 RepID=A0A934PMZ1_9FLAO|nr:hypothetical protein [Flavobacterium agrisoli]MBK0369830.1 hypothetical protein [Flavobacterium agrisoli]